MNNNYSTPRVDDQWLDRHQTHPAVAMAIHAIADSSRTPEKIWEEPTSTEWDHVKMAIEEYINRGLFDAEPKGFRWGCETVSLDA